MNLFILNYDFMLCYADTKERGICSNLTYKYVFEQIPFICVWIIIIESFYYYNYSFVCDKIFIIIILS